MKRLLKMNLRYKATLFSILFYFLINVATAQDLLGLSQIKQNVKSKRVSSFNPTGQNKDYIPNIKDGEKKVIFDVKGVGIIDHIWITIAPPPDVLSRNDIIIRMYWDGNSYPSVETPIGPFFGQGWEESYNYTSLPLSASPVDGRGLVSYFAMPFEKGARIEIENQSGKEISAFFYYVDYMEMGQLPKDFGRFHAWYNHQFTRASEEKEWPVELKPNRFGKYNYVIADIKGKGHFVGVNYYVNNPLPRWYGEGDDMIFIDGDTIPTLNGTGTEDYFNTAWCPKEVYTHPYFGYPRVNNDIGFLGRTHLYRFNISDPIFFDKSLKFTIEHGHNNVLPLDLASVAYWYQSEASRIPAIPNKAGRAPKPVIGFRDIQKWRDEWRKNLGDGPSLWGNEKIKEEQP